MISRCANRSETGTVLVLVLTVLAALLAGAAVALRLQTSDTKAAGLANSARTSLYCAEAGLAASRPIVAAHFSTWEDVLDGTPFPPWYPIQGDIDIPADGVDDYIVTLVDNDDEFAPLPLDPTRDNDLKIYVTSRCVKYPDYPRVVTELIQFQGGGGCVNRNVGGAGCGNSGNVN